ncbi:MAG TPA: YkvA family protein [Rhodocyclaceae bacterium]
MSLKDAARRLRRQSLVVYFAARHPALPWPVRLLALAVAAYALSPIDLIPDFIPVIGYLDDLIIVPLGIALVLRLTPPEVLAEAHRQADAAAEKPVSRIAAAFIVVLWIASAIWLTRLLMDALSSKL